jgi:molecular chaperone HtpG
MWFAVSRYEKQIPVINKMRGIRLRKENIQIGGEETFSYPKFYKEARGNFYFIGEVFAVDSDLRPNARRDYFNTNATLKEFEDEIIPVLYKDFYDLYHYASKVKNSFKRTADFQKKKEEFDDKIKNAGFVDKNEKEEAKKALEIEKDRVNKAQRELELRQKDAERNNVLNRIYTELESTYKQEDIASKEEIKKNSDENKKYLTQSLSKYNKKEQKLISKIYNIIKAMLPKDMAEMVVAKIQEELSK